MPQIPRETVEQVLTATDIVDLIGTYVPVKRAGTRFVALCPFHNEKSPSFSIDPVQQFYHCFGCKKSGDAISFVRDYENLTFVDAVKKLGSRVGITIEEQSLDPQEERDRRKRGRLLDLHREVSRYLHSLLMRSPDAEHAREYLKSRGFGSEMAKSWELGWAPASPKVFLDWAREKGVSGRDLVDSGIALKKETGGLYLRFRDRLMFPIRNDHGDVIAFSGRQLREDPRSGKYINSPETTLFKKSNVLFALDRARKAILDEKAVLICEGQMDAVACQEQGIHHAIACLGTAFTPKHAKTLKRYTKEAILCYDSDSAGFTGAERAFRELTAEGVTVRAVKMPAGEDPDSYMQKHGAEAFRKLLAESVDYFDFVIDHAVAEGRLGNPQQRATFATECASLLSTMGDEVARDTMINHVATRLRTGVPELRAAVKKAKRQANNRRSFENRDQEDAPHEEVKPASLDRRIGSLCTLAIHSLAVRDWLSEQYETIHELESTLSGVPILQAILAGKPDPDSPASINSFLAGLPEDQRMALQQDPSFAEGLPDDPIVSAEQTLADASALSLELEDTRIKAALNDPSLPFEEQMKLLQRAKEIADLLKGIQARALTTDRFSPSTKFQNRKSTWNKGHSKDERKS